MAFLSVENLRVSYGAGASATEVVRGVSFEVNSGETVALVGESGSGKTTTGRAILRLAPVTGGRIVCDGTDLARLSAKAFFPWRKRIQMVFQDPWHSLNPRLSIEAILSEPLEIHFREMDKKARRERVAELLERVGLPKNYAWRYPHELSGGQRQRVGFARALAVEPELVICDEPVSALDVVASGQIMALLAELQAAAGFACLFISHDLALVEQVCRRVLVMRAGEVVEQGAPAEVYARPAHPYTRALLDAVPDMQRAG